MSKDPKKTCHFVLTEGLIAGVDKMAKEDRVDENEKVDRSRTMRAIIRQELKRREEARRRAADHRAKGAES
jgi:metal-responsive CopG/Arc/MetJ family transcriptional regulator